MSDDTHTSDESRKSKEEDVPAIRESQGPMGQPASKDGTWLSGDDRTTRCARKLPTVRAVPSSQDGPARKAMSLRWLGRPALRPVRLR